MVSTRTASTALVPDVRSALVRYRSTAVIAFVCAFSGAVVAVSLMPPEYEATMKLLIKRERMDPLIAPSTQASSPVSGEITEEELNSEVELVQGRDLLEQVVATAGLMTPPADGDGSPLSRRTAIAHAVVDLQEHLSVSAIRRTNLIELRYRSSDPDRAVEVLSQLAHRYVEKHLTVHRPVWAHEFFRAQTRALDETIEGAETQLATFGRDAHVVWPLVERDTLIETLAEFEAALARTQASLVESDQRIRAVKAQLADIPNRQTTQVETEVDGDRIRGLRAQLLTLEMKWADMRVKFDAEYPPLQQVVQQLSQIQAALKDAQATPVVAETTNQNPTHQWLRDELARVSTERDAAAARGEALTRAIVEYRGKARRLDEARLHQDRLVSAVTMAQETHALYQRRREEARISDALDRAQMANVSIAEHATVPELQSDSTRHGLLAGFGVALLLAAMSAVLLDRLQPTDRVPDTVRAFGPSVLVTGSVGRDA